MLPHLALIVFRSIFAIMKKIFLIIGVGVFSIGIFVLGFLAGNYVYDLDVLCEKDFTAHKLTKDFESKEGILLPAGTMVYARSCKPNIDVRLDFFIDNWNYENIEKLDNDPFPVYYLDTKQDDNALFSNDTLND